MKRGERRRRKVTKLLASRNEMVKVGVMMVMVMID